MTRTEPGSQTRDLSLRSTSLHMVSSDSSFSNQAARDAVGVGERIAGAPRVPAMGQVSTRRPSTRTNISGEAPIVVRRRTGGKIRMGWGSPPECARNSSDGLPEYGVWKDWRQNDFIVFALAHALRVRFRLWPRIPAGV